MDQNQNRFVGSQRFESTMVEMDTKVRVFEITALQTKLLEILVSADIHFEFCDEEGFLLKFPLGFFTSDEDDE